MWPLWLQMSSETAHPANEPPHEIRVQIEDSLCELQQVRDKAGGFDITIVPLRLH